MTDVAIFDGTTWTPKKYVCLDPLRILRFMAGTKGFCMHDTMHAIEVELNQYFKDYFNGVNENSAIPCL